MHFAMINGSESSPCFPEKPAMSVSPPAIIAASSKAVLYRYRAGIPWRDPWSGQGQACMGQLLSSLMVGEVNGRLGWVRAGLTIRGERAIGLQPNTLVFGRPRVGLDHDAAMRIGGEAPGGGPIL